MKSIKIITFIIFFIILFEFSMAKTIYTYNNTQNEHDPRKFYELEVLKTALEKTIEKYGEYELIPSPRMNLKRAITTLKLNTIKNFILKMSITKELLDELAYANFPIDRGIVGYRVSFISPKMKNKIGDFNTLEKLKKLRIGQGIGWLDVDILRHNGFNVKTISDYEALFNMTVLNRIDLFSRGINEILGEYESYKHIKNLDHDRTFVLYYPLPRFFFTHKSNEKAMKRIEEGLILAYKDGTLDKIFDKYYKNSIEFLHLENRKIYKLENPFLKDIDNTYEKYIFNPFE